MENVRVRFAPSPTGYLHIGGLRTALYNELFARNQKGVFILRIEDTDQTRYVEGAIENLCRSLEACGIVPDEGVWLDKKGGIIERGEYGPYLQSTKKEVHRAYADELVRMGKAYHCFCTAERLEKLRTEQQAAGSVTMYDGQCRGVPNEEAQSRIRKGEAYVIRLKLPEKGSIRIHDLIRGDVSFDWSVIDDQVIIKSDGFPTYHLAATCDDHDMKISHVVRAEDWLSSTPKHVFIYEAFGWDVPQFAHLPLLLNSDRSKLSKRQGDVAVEDYLKKGYLPEALLNFVALLGWNPTGDREIYTHEELVSLFDIEKVNKAGAVFNVEKLDWLNAQYIRSLPVERYLTLVHPYVAELTDDGSFADRCLLLVRDRVERPSDVTELTSFFFRDHLEYDRVSIPWKTQPASETIERLSAVKEHLQGLDENVALEQSAVETSIKALITERGWGNGDTLWPLRVALSGKDKSPSPFELIAAYGKKRALSRIEDALAHLS